MIGLGWLLLAFSWVSPVWAAEIWTAEIPGSSGGSSVELRADPSPRQLLRDGVAAFQAEDYQLAVERFTAAIAAEPDLAAYSNRCLAQIYLNAYEQAIADCTAALEFSSREPESLLNRGLAYYRLGEFSNAIADYNALLQLKPHDFRAYYNRGLAQAELQAYREALVDYGEAMRQISPLDHSTLAEVHNDRGLAQLQLEHWPQAIADFTQAIQFNNSSLRAYYNRGCAYHHQGNLTASLNDFSQVLQLDPNHAQSYLSRGLVQQQLGHQQDALSDLQQAARYFQRQGAVVAYQQTLNLIERLRGTGVAIG
ncbi:MAG: tetratricopeptide repeat protein [Elainella sp.]